MAKLTWFIHTSIGVSDMDKAVAFYKDILGFKVVGLRHFKGEEPARVMHVGKHTDFSVALLQRDDQRLELIHFKDPKSPAHPTLECNHIGLSHITFLTDDAEGMMRELKAKGVEVLEGTLGALSEQRPGKIFLFRGPDGVICEVSQLAPGAPKPYLEEDKIKQATR